MPVNDDMAGVLCYVTNFSANPKTEPNKIYYDSYTGDAFPKVFDVNLTVTVLNENLTNTQQQGVLNDPYFYNYSTDFHHAVEENEEQINIETQAGETSVDQTSQAYAESLLASGDLTQEEYNQFIASNIFNSTN